LTRGHVRKELRHYPSASDRVLTPSWRRMGRLVLCSRSRMFTSPSSSELDLVQRMAHFHVAHIATIGTKGDESPINCGCTNDPVEDGVKGVTKGVAKMTITDESQTFYVKRSKRKGAQGMQWKLPNARKHSIPERISFDKDWTELAYPESVDEVWYFGNRMGTGAYKIIIGAYGEPVGILETGKVSNYSRRKPGGNDGSWFEEEVLGRIGLLE